LRADWASIELWVEAHRDDTVQIVEYLISESAGGLPGGVSIYYQRNQMNVGSTLSEYNITVDTELIGLLFRGNGRTIFRCAPASCVLHHAAWHVHLEPQYGCLLPDLPCLRYPALAWPALHYHWQAGRCLIRQLFWHWHLLGHRDWCHVQGREQTEGRSGAGRLPPPGQQLTLDYLHPVRPQAAAPSASPAWHLLAHACSHNACYQ
jgi:hypothetical protein